VRYLHGDLQQADFWPGIVFRLSFYLSTIGAKYPTRFYYLEPNKLCSAARLFFLQLRGPVQHYCHGIGRCRRRINKKPLAVGSDVPTENLHVG
jgi:hypothetical protein